MEIKLSYTKEQELQVLRTKHIVSFYKGDRAQDVLNSMKHVPFESRVLSWEEDGDEFIINFIEEKSVQARQANDISTTQET